ncbi:hypothetical protein HHK36_021895 [Tetracentron sinense]|uniref:protein-disulfide reductase n=1 Tax=Tetracentron sinense TaxID=13715 RepID=A0A835DB26_TETSI|nr:hypothetical protein HHK36_021895 [Tetracentron sinense]
MANNGVGSETHDLRSLLTDEESDCLVRRNGDQVPVSELEGKMVGLYFSLSSFRSCRQCTRILVDIYLKLKERGERFEVVLITMDKDEESFNNDLKNMPWLALPFGNKSLDKLLSYFEPSTIPTLVIIGPDGKTLSLNARDYVEGHGIQAYPFSKERLAEIDEKENERCESQTLESLLVADELDFVIGKGSVKVRFLSEKRFETFSGIDGKVPVSQLVGKIVLFYFSRQQCPPCRAFTPKLVEDYHKIKAKHHDFEVIFVSLDNDQQSFEDYYFEMPWLVLPYGDKRENSLKRMLKLTSIPHLVAVGSTGRTLTSKAKELVMFFGPDAYPFNNDRMKEMESRIEEMGMGLPEKVRHYLHAEHELLRSPAGVYTCDGCNQLVLGWVFKCDECDYYLHPKCALEEDREVRGESEGHGNHEHAHDGHDQASNGGWVCDGEVCYRT